MTAQRSSIHSVMRRIVWLQLSAKMNRLLSTLAASAILLTSAMAQNIGVSLAYSDDLFLTTLRQAMEQRAKELGVKIQFDHAQGDIGKQLN